MLFRSDGRSRRSAVKNSRSRDSRGFSSLYVRASETAGTHLAHWPPPRYEREATPMRIKHDAGEPAKRAKPRGWRLTRAFFSEFADEES
ncbi:MAG: hypothetical protein JO365_32160 [Bradyrhizobium sp.]|nr:hypothetical protein [Bradyrhizobium sp.]